MSAFLKTSQANVKAWSYGDPAVLLPALRVSMRFMASLPEKKSLCRVKIFSLKK
jgi:hypothetical protein